MKEKVYKIQKIEKYSHKLNLEKSSNLVNIVLLGSGALLLVSGILGGHNTMDLVDSISIVSGSSMTITGIMGYAKSIGKQTLLEDKILNLQEELTNNPFMINGSEEDRGMKI